MENILTAMARQFLPQMEPEERAEALRSLKRMIDEEFFAMAVAESGTRRPVTWNARDAAPTTSSSAGWTAEASSVSCAAAARGPSRRGPTACSRRRSSTARPG